MSCETRQRLCQALKDQAQNGCSATSELKVQGHCHPQHVTARFKLQTTESSLFVLGGQCSAVAHYMLQSGDAAAVACGVAPVGGRRLRRA